MAAPWFYGYNVVAASFVVQGVLIGAMFAYGVFFPEIEAELGWSRATISGASSLAFVVMGALAVAAGRLSDRFGPRALIAWSGVFFAVGYGAMSVMQAPWQLFVFYGVLAGVGFSTHDVVTLSTVARWFVRRRGLMSGVTKVGTGIGQVLMPLAATGLVALLGWREAALVLGVASGVVLVGAAQLMRRDPGAMGLAPDGAPAPAGGGPRPAAREPGVGLREAAAMPQLWILSAAELLVLFCLLTVMVHIVPHGVDSGLSRPVASSLLATIGGVSVLGRLAVGASIDRIGGRRALTACFAILLASFVLIQWAPSPAWLFVFAAVYGVAHGGFFTAMSPTVAEMFGTGSHGVLFGIVLCCGTVGGAVGPLLAGALFDATGTYRLVFWLLAGASVAGLVLVSALHPPRVRAPIAASSGGAAE